MVVNVNLVRAFRVGRMWVRWFDIVSSLNALLDNNRTTIKQFGGSSKETHNFTPEKKIGACEAC